MFGGLTIRGNILLGLPYIDQSLYWRVVAACELMEDLEALSGLGGDLAPVAEGGASLSGGQKARVCLARAVYAGIWWARRANNNNNNSIISTSNCTPLILLDDPFRAVDRPVARRVAFNLFHHKTGLLTEEPQCPPVILSSGSTWWVEELWREQRDLATTGSSSTVTEGVVSLTRNIINFHIQIVKLEISKTDLYSTTAIVCSAAQEYGSRQKRTLFGNNTSKTLTMSSSSELSKSLSGTSKSVSKESNFNLNSDSGGHHFVPAKEESDRRKSNELNNTVPTTAEVSACNSEDGHSDSLNSSNGTAPSTKVNDAETTKNSEDRSPQLQRKSVNTMEDDDKKFQISSERSSTNLPFVKETTNQNQNLNNNRLALQLSTDNSDPNRKCLPEESREIGAVGSATYRWYVKSMGLRLATVLFFTLVAIMVFQNYCSVLLLHWTSGGQQQVSHLTQSVSNNNDIKNLKQSSSSSLSGGTLTEKDIDSSDWSMEVGVSMTVEPIVLTTGTKSTTVQDESSSGVGSVQVPQAELNPDTTSLKIDSAYNKPPSGHRKSLKIHKEKSIRNPSTGKDPVESATRTSRFLAWLHRVIFLDRIDLNNNYDNNNKNKKSSSTTNSPFFLLKIYCYFVFGYVVSCLLGHAFEIVGGMRASRKIFKQSLHQILFKRSFFWWDCNPSWRVLNRFALDTNAMDEAVSSVFGVVIGFTLYFFGHAVVLSFVAGPVCCLFILACVCGVEEYARIYRESVRELQRGMLVANGKMVGAAAEINTGSDISGTLSEVNSSSSATENTDEPEMSKIQSFESSAWSAGDEARATLSAFGQESRFLARFLLALDDLKRFEFTKFSLVRWLEFRMGLVSMLLTLAATLSPIIIPALLAWNQDIITRERLNKIQLEKPLVPTTSTGVNSESVTSVTVTTASKSILKPYPTDCIAYPYHGLAGFLVNSVFASILKFFTYLTSLFLSSVFSVLSALLSVFCYIICFGSGSGSAGAYTTPSAGAAALLALSIEYSTEFLEGVLQLVRNWSDLETRLVSIERLRDCAAPERVLNTNNTSSSLLEKWRRTDESLHINDINKNQQEKSEESDDNRPKILSLTNVSVFYGPNGYDLRVLHSINLSVRAGEVIAVTGRTGAGKSSLILAILGLAKYTGDVRIMSERDRLARQNQEKGYGI